MIFQACTTTCYFKWFGGETLKLEKIMMCVFRKRDERNYKEINGIGITRRLTKELLNYFLVIT